MLPNRPPVHFNLSPVYSIRSVSHRLNPSSRARASVRTAARHQRPPQPLRALSRASSSPFLFRRNYATSHGLPFKLSRRDAEKVLLANKSFLENAGPAESTSLALSKGDPIKACFLPFHSAGVRNLTSIVSGRHGHDRVVHEWVPVFDGKNTTMQYRTRVETDWYNCSFTMPLTDYPFGTKHTQIYAGFDYPRKLVEGSLRCAEVVSIEPLSEQLLSIDGKKITVFPHEMNMSNALEKLTASLYGLEQNRAHNYILNAFNADHADVSAVDVLLSEAEISLLSYHMPAYVFQSSVLDLTAYKFINAYSGNIDGNTIYSIARSAILGAGIGGVMSFAFAAMTRPYLLVPQLLLRFAMGSTIGAAFSALSAKLHNEHQNAEFISGMQREARENADYPQSDEDLERRRFAAEANGEIEYVRHRGHVRLPEDKCRLLGLDPESGITLETVKKAYHRQIKRWHPDLFRENNSKKAQAEAMTKQLNDANRELTDILSKAPGNKT